MSQVYNLTDEQYEKVVKLLNHFTQDMNTRQMSLIITPMVTGSLSFFGSICIIYRILYCERRQNNDNNSYLNHWTIFHPMMFMMSIIDAITSINFALSTLPLNTDIAVPEIEIWGAHGNQLTCSVSGFVNALVNAEIFYNIFILLYFTAFVYGYNIDTSVKKFTFVTSKCIEYIIHGLALLYPIVFGLYTTFMGYMNPNPTLYFCFLAAYPPLCDIFDETSCTRGPPPRWTQYVLFLAPQYLAFGIFLPCIVLIQAKVCKMGLSLSNIQTQQQQFDHNNTAAADTDIARNNNNNNENNNNRRVLILQNYTREVTIQSLLYALSFTNTFIWTSIPYAIIDKKGYNPAKLIGVIYPYALLSQIFFPLQGFTNALIYFGPRYRRLRKIHRNMSCHALLKETIGGTALSDGAYCHDDSSDIVHSRSPFSEQNGDSNIDTRDE